LNIWTGNAAVLAGLTESAETVVPASLGRKHRLLDIAVFTHRFGLRIHLIKMKTLRGFKTETETLKIGPQDVSSLKSSEFVDAACTQGKA